MNIRLMEVKKEYRVFIPLAKGICNIDGNIEICGKSENIETWIRLIIHEISHLILDDFVSSEYHHEIMKELKLFGV